MTNSFQISSVSVYFCEVCPASASSIRSLKLWVFLFPTLKLAVGAHFFQLLQRVLNKCIFYFFIVFLKCMYCKLCYLLNWSHRPFLSMQSFVNCSTASIFSTKFLNLYIEIAPLSPFLDALTSFAPSPVSRLVVFLISQK